MSNNFYRAFEDRYRGNKELIKSRLITYIPFLEKIKDVNTNPKAIDLGCGRGEWLELLSANGFIAKGVDLDESMLEDCKEKGFDVKLQDAIESIKSLDDSSVELISGFHIVEHIPFEDIQTLVQEALRVLTPAGLLILETPNPENIQVATSGFYIDPTHTRPIPSQLLSFLPEYYGFKRTKILRLQEENNLKNSEFTTIENIINGASPDYAVIAQKNAKNETLELFDECFSKDYGLTIDTLTLRFENRLKSIENQINESNNRAIKAEQQIISLLNSNSWRITKPLRALSNLVRKLINKN